MKVKANGIEIEVEDTGGSGPVVLLIMGLGMQLTAWPPTLVDGLVQAGYRVVRHDNRDAGLSQYFDEYRTPSILWSMLRTKIGMNVRPVYTLGEMALDAIGVLDALGIEQAHVVGASMGGMIAQRVAIDGPERVLSLTSIMSSSGAKDLPSASPDVIRVLLERVPKGDLAVAMDRSVRLYKLIGSPGFPTPEADLRERVKASLARAHHPRGVLRQMLAIGADARRCQELMQIEAPTLVIHGRDDPLVPLACGEDTARRIRGARMEIIDGMGHDLPLGVVERILPLLLGHMASHAVLPEQV